jgi:glutathione S-transferase
MKLLCTKRSPYARKVRIVAVEKQIPLKLVEEDLANKSSELLGANPAGKIPVLILDNGQTLSNSPLLCEYLDSLNNQPVLIPKEAEERFKVLNFTAMADGLMDVTVATYLEKVRHPRDYNEVFIQNQEQTIKRCLNHFEQRIKELQQLSLAPIAVACAIGYINFRLAHLWPQAEFLELLGWFEEFSKRPSMAATIPA